MSELPAYLRCMAIGWCLCVIAYTSLLRQRSGRGLAAGCLTLVLGPALGLICAKLGYVLLRINIMPRGAAFWPYLVSLNVEELSFWGGAAGVTLGVALAAKLAGLKPGEALNAFAPWGALMVAFARYAERYLGMLGVGMYLESGFFPYAQGIAWDPEYTEWYLAVFMLEALFALVALVLSLRHRGEPRRFLRTLFYLCLPQILCESLRMNTIVWLFVKAEQVVCYAFCEAVLVWMAFRLGRRERRHWLPAVVGLVVLLLTVAEEFALDKTDIPHWITYSAMALGLAAMAWAEHRGEQMLLKA